MCPLRSTKNEVLGSGRSNSRPRLPAMSSSRRDFSPAAGMIVDVLSATLPQSSSVRVARHGERGEDFQGH